VGFALGIGMSLIASESIGEVVSFIVFGAAVGLAQWLVLRRFFEGSGWWILATALGSAAGLSLTNMIHRILLGVSGYLVAGSLGGAALGLVVGIAQWMVLRRHLRKASWWVIVTAAGWSAGSIAAWAFSLQFIEFYKIMTEFALIGTVVSISTGLVLLLLKKNTPPFEDMRTSPIRIWAMAICSLVLITLGGVRDITERAPIGLGSAPDLSAVSGCVNLPSQDCGGDDTFCSEVVFFEPTTGPGYINYPVNGETWDEQYRSFLRRDLLMLIKYSSARVACETVNWDYRRFQPVGFGDMSEEDGANPGTSRGHPDHPMGTHEDGNDIDVAYFQIDPEGFLKIYENRQQGVEGNLLRSMCKNTRFGMDVYHCIEQPWLLDPWRTALFIAHVAENPYVRVIGVDGKIGPVVDDALDQLVQAGWIDKDLRDRIPLAYETTNEGMGWFRFHHHHLHISMHIR
jgi:hypothetical protein